MSARDVSAHYSAGEGLTALLGGMERATLESISIENSARHTHTHTHAHTEEGAGGGSKPPGLSLLPSSLTTTS